MEEPRTTQNKKFKLLSSEPDLVNLRSAHPKFFHLTVWQIFSKMQAKNKGKAYKFDKNDFMSYTGKSFLQKYIKECSYLTMTENELKNLVCQTVGGILSPDGSPYPVKMDDYLAMDRRNMGLFADLMSEKTSEDFSFLEGRRFHTVADLYDEIAQRLPITICHANIDPNFLKEEHTR